MTALDQSQIGFGSNNSVSSGSATTSQANEILLGIIENGTNTELGTPGSGWTMPPNPQYQFDLESRVVSSIGSYAATASYTTNPNWSAHVLSFMATTGGNVTVSPTTATLGQSQTQQFTATVTGTSNQNVSWSLSPNVGNISSAGLYTAPATISSTQNVTVTATSQAGSGGSGTATVTLAAVSVSVSPSSYTLYANGQQQFTATVTGTPNQNVTWSISPSVGSLSSTSTNSTMYVAPGIITTAQTVTLTATSTDDGSVVGSATITLDPPAGPSVYYYIEDQLGTSRVITDSAGNICYDADFYPFGGERPVVNTCPQHYKFTSKERDPESNLDYFEARFYSSQTGRFMSPDWSKNPQGVPYADFNDPQTLNLYGYVRNDPTSKEDVDGHSIWDWLRNLDPHSGPTNIGGSDPAPSPQSTQQNVKAQQQTGRQPNGSYIAPTGPGSEIYNRTHGGKNGQVLHPPDDTQGQCVTACKHFSGITAPTTAWREGAAVSGNSSIPIGTAIATFGSNGKYPTNEDQNSGIYLGPGGKPGSILIFDQWPAYPSLGTAAQPPHIREMPFNSDYGHSMANSASAYHVIIVP